MNNNNNPIEFISNTSLQEIKESNVLSIENLKKLELMVPELKHNLETQTIWRTETEIRCSVLNDREFPDNASKYHQAKLEQQVFFEQLFYLSLEYNKKELDLQLLELDIEEIENELKDDPNNKRMGIKLKKMLIDKKEIVYELMSMKKKAEDRFRELNIWSGVKKELDDGSFDKDDKNTNQLISLTIKYIIQFYDMHTNGVKDATSIKNVKGHVVSLLKECGNKNVMKDLKNKLEENKLTPLLKWTMSQLNA